MVTAASFLFTAAVIAVFGVLIRQFQMMELIAGYDPDQVTDDEGLARFAGTSLLVLAGLTALVGILELVGPVDGQPVVYGLYTLAVVAIAGYLVYRSQRY
jgi:hypothetical protein